MTETASSRVIGALRSKDSRLPDELSPDSGVAFDLVMTPVRIPSASATAEETCWNFSVKERTSSTSTEDSPEMTLSLALSKS